MAKVTEFVIENGVRLRKAMWTEDAHHVTVYYNDKNNLHREIGPAYIYEDKSGRIAMSWYHDQLLHRYDGPAAIERDGEHGYWIHGKEVTEEVKTWMKKQGYDFPKIEYHEKWKLEKFMRQLEQSRSESEAQTNETHPGVYQMISDKNMSFFRGAIFEEICQMDEKSPQAAMSSIEKIETSLKELKKKYN